MAKKPTRAERSAANKAAWAAMRAAQAGTPRASKRKGKKASTIVSVPRKPLSRSAAVALRWGQKRDAHKAAGTYKRRKG